jgi:hypothetical protein
MVHTQFKWSWYHVPTFAPYKVECVFYPLILASGGHAQTTKTALVVLQSLTPNAQSVFRVLAEYQLANEKEEGEIVVHLVFWMSSDGCILILYWFWFSGMPMSSLYTKCRERFLVSSQVTLNSHLTEFKDHDLVKVRKHSDGQDCLRIPLVSDALEKLLEELAWHHVFGHCQCAIMLQCAPHQRKMYQLGKNSDYHLFLELYMDYLLPKFLVGSMLCDWSHHLLGLSCFFKLLQFDCCLCSMCKLHSIIVKQGEKCPRYGYILHISVYSLPRQQMLMKTTNLYSWNLSVPFNA